MDSESAARRIMVAYPKVFMACHTRHRRNSRSKGAISSHQGHILDHLDENEPMTLTGLAEHMGVTPSTMSLNVDRLERKGLAVRSKDSADGRRVLLRLTIEGARLKDAQSVLELNLLRSLVERLSAQERERAVAGLETLGQAADAEMNERGREKPVNR